jgi:hypothetical protein
MENNAGLTRIRDMRAREPTLSWRRASSQPVSMNSDAHFWRELTDCSSCIPPASPALRLVVVEIAFDHDADWSLHWPQHDPRRRAQ